MPHHKTVPPQFMDDHSNRAPAHPTSRTPPQWKLRLLQHTLSSEDLGAAVFLATYYWLTQHILNLRQETKDSIICRGHQCLVNYTCLCSSVVTILKLKLDFHTKENSPYQISTPAMVNLRLLASFSFNVFGSMTKHKIHHTTPDII